MADKQTVTPPAPQSFFWLSVLRLVMLWLLCSSYYFFHAADGWQKGFIFAAFIVLTLNHVTHYRNNCNFTLWPHLIDFITGTSVGFVFLGQSNAYMIFFAVFAVTLMLDTDSIRIRIFGIGLTLAVWLVMMMSEFHWIGADGWVGNVLNISLFIFSCLVGSLIRYYMTARTRIAGLYDALDQSHRSLQLAHDQLSDYARQVEELTATRERNHIAREIHDTVGHRMTALLVQLQMARKLQDRDPEQSKETLLRCEELARSALQEVRLSVRALHEETATVISIIEQLRPLLSDFSQMTELECELNVEGNPALVSYSLQPTIIRLVQEALTNAKRHGNATRASVTLRCQPEKIELILIDNGVGAAEVNPGFGMANMRERVSEQGGNVLFSSEKGGGFRIRVTFPLQEQSWRFGGRRA